MNCEPMVEAGDASGMEMAPCWSTSIDSGLAFSSIGMAGDGSAPGEVTKALAGASAEKGLRKEVPDALEELSLPALGLGLLTSSFELDRVRIDRTFRFSFSAA